MCFLFICNHYSFSCFYKQNALFQLPKFLDNLKTIGDHAFYNCEKLTSLPAFPPSSTIIGYSAFQNCKLTSLTFTHKIDIIHPTAFNNCEIKYIICNSQELIVHYKKFFAFESLQDKIILHTV